MMPLNAMLSGATAALAVQAINRAIMGLTVDVAEDSPVHYLVRPVAYALIVWAIIAKITGARSVDDGFLD